MIPKPGDVVDINPKFKKAWYEYHNKPEGSISPKSWGEDPDGHVHVRAVKSHGSDRFFIPTVTSGYSIDGNGWAYDWKHLEHWGYPIGEPLFLPVGKGSHLGHRVAVSSELFCKCPSPCPKESSTCIAGGGVKFTICESCQKEIR